MDNNSIYREKYLKYKIKYLNLKKKLSEQTGGYEYNLHHKAGNYMEAKTAARGVVSFNNGIENWFRQVKDWSIEYDKASTEQERNNAKGNINAYIGEINTKFIAAGSEIRFTWKPIAHWQAGAQKL